MIDGMPPVILQPDLIKKSASSLRTKLSKMHQFQKQAKSMKFNENQCKYTANQWKTNRNVREFSENH